MRSFARVRLTAGAVALTLVGVACGALGQPESAWVADEDAIAERRADDREAEAREALTDLVGDLGALESVIAACVVDTLIEEQGALAPEHIAAADPAAARLVGPLSSGVRGCGAGHVLAHRWIPELTVVPAAQDGTLDCVRPEATEWAADRFASIVVAGGLAPDESVVDRAWLGRLVDRCDAGAAMMTARATLHPQVGADARTPSRWRCAASSAPAGAFDELLDAAVIADETRLETVESRITRWFDGCR